jgi:general secretion pathway protein F
MRYRVKFIQGDSGIASVTVEGPTEAQARQQAQALGHSVVSIVRDGNWSRAISSKKVAFPLVLFSQELLSLLSSGIGVVEALETLAEKEVRPAVRSVLRNLLEQLQEGRTLSAALQSMPDTFPALYVASVKASERTSDLNEALQRYVVYASQLEVVRVKLVSAAIYPVMLVIVSGLVISFLMGFVVPRFSQIYEDMGDQLPWMSRLMLDVGQVVQQYGLLLLFLVAVSGCALFMGGARQIWGFFLKMLWRIPSAGERLRVFQLTRLYRTLGMLLRGGIPIATSLEMVSGLLSPVMQPRLLAASNLIREGQTLSGAFESNGLCTAVSSRMLRVGERAGNMGEMMERAAAFHDEETARWADWLSRLLGPALMLIMGILIGLIVVLMYLRSQFRCLLSWLFRLLNFGTPVRARARQQPA